MTSYNPSPRTIPVWLWAGAAVVVATVVLAAVCPGERARVVTLGFVAIALFIASGMYTARKRLFLSRLGTLHAWMIGHMVLGGAMLVAIVLHGGVSELGTQGWLLYALTLAELGSGAWGLYELKATPRRFAQFAGDDFMYPSAVRARIERLQLGIDTVLEHRKPEFRDWVESRWGAARAGESATIAPLDDIPKGQTKFATDIYAKLEDIVRLRAQQARLEAVDRQSRRWLYVHVPVAVAFVVFVGIHVAGWLYYG